MKVDLPDHLQKLKDGAKGKPKFGADLAKAFKAKLQLLDAAVDERDLRGWRSLHYEKLQGRGEGERSIRLNDQWRLTFTLNEATTPPTITVIDIEDYH